MAETNGGEPEATGYLNALAHGARELSAANRFTDGVQRLLARIGEASGVSRVWVFQLIELSDDQIVQDYVFEWAAADRYRQLTLRRFRFFSMTFDDAQFADIVAQRSAGVGRSFLLDDFTPGTWHDYLATQDLVSCAAVPIVVDGRWWGTLGVDDCERVRDWAGPMLDTLTVAAELIGSALNRQDLASRSLQMELFHKVSDCGVWELDFATGEPWCSQGLRRTLGYPDSYPKVPLRRLLERIDRDDRAELMRHMRQVLRTRAGYWRHDVRIRGAAGDERWSEIVADITYGEDHRPATMAGLVIDISHRKSQEEQAVSASHRDALTELLNRRGFEQRFALLSATAGTPLGEDAPAAHLLLLDIDHFKQINDRHGHPAGDALLRDLTSRIRKSLSEEDAFARFGGEEFAILLEGVTPAQALALAERIRKSVANQPFTLPVAGKRALVLVKATLSIGVARLPDLEEPMARQAAAIAHADEALYAAKRGGRNRVVVHDREVAA